ncbi:RNA polymerase sigma-70 factor [Rudanella lutea]|uniref:RNA polymerase sigma-70 factor n=1 Tax=Rudanella lutea TaxID=451374 RepID=UPI000362FBF0|nr:RNA polymerase sigma-70 factor [Rudanella lutea]
MQRVYPSDSDPSADKFPFSVGGPVGEGKLTDDELLLRQHFEKDAAGAFALLFRRYYKNLVNHALRFVYGREVAEDLVADVFTHFWQEELYKTVHTSYRAYLYQTVRYRAYNYIRCELHPANSLDAADDQPTLAYLQPDQIIQYSELQHKIEVVVQQLPPQCQRAFLLSRIEGKKYAEIAQVLHISSSAVEKLLIRALQKLRQELQAGRFLSVMFIFCHSAI